MSDPLAQILRASAVAFAREAERFAPSGRGDYMLAVGKLQGVALALSLVVGGTVEEHIDDARDAARDHPLTELAGRRTVTILDGAVSITDNSPDLEQRAAAIDGEVRESRSRRLGG